MYFKALFLFGIVFGACSSTSVDFSQLKCKGRTPPAHGRLDCQEDLNTQKVSCRMSCDPGYDVEYLAAMRYVCNPDGTWTPEPSSADSHWPNCKIYSRGEPVP
ncbi:uncharacterized protein LOC144663982 [Oculina patagonica]